MGTFFDKQTEKLDLDDKGNYVILQQPTYGEMQYVTQQAMKFSMKMSKDGNSDGSADIDIVEMEILTLVACIKEWGGPGFGSMKVNRENILALPQNIVELIKPKVNEMTKIEDSDSKKNSKGTTD